MSVQRFSVSLLLLLGILFLANSPRGFAVDAKATQAGKNTQTEAADLSDEEAKKAKAEAAEREVGQGSLRIIGEDGSIVECPLKHTDVQADVSGFIARVNVTQTFHNPKDEAIEAVYVFPLPHEAAVDEMTMVLGERKVVGVIKRREEARRIYEQALMQGQTAALLEQERPNIFTQSVGNIAPGQEVKIEISYVDVLKYDMGEYEFHFPMVVGPRFIPGAPVSSPQPTPAELKDKVSPPVPNTTRVTDAARITPPVLRPEVRNGHDIRLALSINAGVPVQDLSVANHQADIRRDGDRRATIELSPEDSLPNKDFVVRYRVVGAKPEMAILAHTGEYSGDARKLGTGYFMLMIQPQEDERLKKSPPREMVFLVDVSGSMRGDKTAKTREMMQQMLGLCRDKDTVQVMTFASRAQKLFERPLPVNEASIKRALNFTSNLRGSGGTQMLQGVKLAIDEPIDKERIRIVVMLTDGFIGNEAEIIAHVGKNCGDQVRFWTVGVGQSPNMFLIDGVAKQGGGMGKRLGLKDEAEPLSHEVMTRIQRAQLASVKIDWGEMQVTETYPARIPELWAGRPVILFGRYRDGGRHEINISGKVEGEPIQWPLAVNLPKEQAANDVLAKVWSRRKIEDLMHKAYYGGSPAIEEEVTALALDYRLMSQYTSFVAVDEKDAGNLPRPAKPPRRMLVPVPLPEGAQWEGFFGESKKIDALALSKLSLAGSVRGRTADPRLAPRGGLGRGGWAYKPTQSLQQASPMAPTVYYEQQTRFTRQAPQAVSLFSMFSSPRGATATAASQVAVSNDLDFGFEDESLQRGLNYTAAAVRAHTQQLSKAAQQAIQSATELQEKGDNIAARDALLRACFLDQAVANVGGSPGRVAQAAVAALQKIHHEQVAAWTKDQPQLAVRLDLVIRDRSIPEAMQQLAAASDATSLSISIEQGSIDDAKALPNNDVRVSYLDLRGATLAQALDWVLQPARLSWRLEKDGIVVGADRRLSGRSGWVYDVSRIALPSNEELKGLTDQNKLIAVMKEAADGFLTVARAELAPNDDLSVVWFAPGQLLVFGEPERHNQVAELVAKLMTVEDGGLQGASAELQQITAKRSEQRQEFVGKLSAARQLRQVADSHATFGWQLLAAAAGGRVDDEALTELKIAWHDSATQKLLVDNGRSLAMRSLWIVTESASALPDEPELRELASFALAKAEPFLEKTLQQVAEDEGKTDAYAGLLYAALAMRNDASLRTRALEVLAKSSSDASLGPVHVLAKSLLADQDQVDTDALSQLVSTGVSGADLITLTGLACRRVGGDAWQTFRAESRDLLSSQPLPGHVVVLVDHLSRQQLLLTRAAR